MVAVGGRGGVVGVVDVCVGGVGSGNVPFEHAVAPAGVGAAAGREVEVGPLGAGERPVIGRVPAVRSHDEDVDGRVVFDAVVDALQEVVVPARDVAVEVDLRFGAVVDAADDAVVEAVEPGADDQAGTPGLGRGAVGLHAEVVDGGAGEVRVEPAGHVERRHGHARKALRRLVLHPVPVWIGSQITVDPGLPPASVLHPPGLVDGQVGGVQEIFPA